jgi:hypothetical protein
MTSVQCRIVVHAPRLSKMNLRAVLLFSHQKALTKNQGSRMQAQCSVTMPAQMLPTRMGEGKIRRLSMDGRSNKAHASSKAVGS